MPPDSISSPQSGLTRRIGDAICTVPVAWRGPLAQLAAAILVIGLIAAREWGEMAHQWWNIDTYNHILLVPFIAIWLVWPKADELAQIAPRPAPVGLALVAAAFGLWFAGRLTGINLIAHAGAVGAVQGAIVAVLGVRIAVLLALPLGFLAFLVPFGDEIIPVLQAITAKMAIALTQFSGVPARIDGIFIDTPAGLFIVAEECSGVKFLVAMITLAVLVSFTRFKSWSRRALFMLASVIVPVLANGVRAWGTIYIAQFAGVEFAAGFDHIIYGWVFFAIVVTILLAAAWRFFECEPEEYGYRTSELEGFAWIARFDTSSASGVVILAAIVAIGLAAALVGAIAAPAGLA